MGTQMMVRMQLAGLFGSPELTGVNMGGSFAAFGVLMPAESLETKPTSRVFLAGLVPVTDYDKFISGNPNVGQPDANGISTIAVAKPAPPQPGEKIAKPKPAMLVAQLGGFALVSPTKHYDGLLRYKTTGTSASAQAAPLAGVLDAAEAKQAAKEPLWAYGNVKLASKTIGPILLGKLEEMKTTITDMDSNMQESIDKLEQMREKLAETDSGMAEIDNINQKIQKLKEQHSDLQARIGKFEQEKSRLANIDPNEKAEVEKLQKQVEMLRKLKEVAGNIQRHIEEFDRLKVDLPSQNQAAIDRLDRQIQRLKDQQNRSAALPTQEAFANIMDMYVAILETLMKETRALTVTANPKPNVLHLSSTISAIPGTTMADMFTEDASLKQENKLLGYLEDGAAMNVSAKLTGKLNAKAMDFFAALFSKDMTDEDRVEIKTLAADIADVFDGVDAMTLSIDPKSKPPFAIKYVIEIDDKQKFDELIDKSAELFKTTGIADFYKKLGIEISFTIKRNVGTYKGVSIDSANLIMKSTEPNTPPGKMIDALYSGGFDYRWGVVDGLCVMAIGSEPDSMIREMIDQVKAGGPKELGSEVKAALELLPQADKADLIGTYNYVRLLGMVGTMMQGMGDPNIQIPQINIPSKSNINFAGQIGSDKMTLDIALPKQHLTEIVSVFQMLMQQKMKMQKPGTMPGPTAPQGPGANTIKIE